MIGPECMIGTGLGDRSGLHDHIGLLGRVWRTEHVVRTWSWDEVGQRPEEIAPEATYDEVGKATLTFPAGDTKERRRP